MNWLPIVINFLVAILVIVSLLIILLVLMQRPKNEGLGAAFGGGMTENLFGAQTTNVLQTVTRYLGGIFFALTLLLSWLYVKKSTSGGSTLHQRLSAPTVIPATPAPATPAPDDKLPFQVATPAPVPGLSPPGAVSDPVKALPATPAPVPVPPQAVPEAAKPAPTEKPTDKPAATPSAPEKQGN